MRNKLAGENDINTAAYHCASAFYIFSRGEGDFLKEVNFHVEKCANIFRSKSYNSSEHEDLFGFNIESFSKSLLAQANALHGNFDIATRIANEAVSIAREPTHIASLGLALMYQNEVFIQCGFLQFVLLYKSN